MSRDLTLGAPLGETLKFTLDAQVIETGYTESGEEALSVVAELRNASAAPISVFIMTCSWSDSFRFEPEDRLRISEWDCYRNFPEEHILQPGELISFRFRATIGCAFNQALVLKEPIAGKKIRVGFVLRQSMQGWSKDYNATIWSADVAVPLNSLRTIRDEHDMKSSPRQALTRRLASDAWVDNGSTVPAEPIRAMIYVTFVDSWFHPRAIDPFQVKSRSERLGVIPLPKPVRVAWNPDSLGAYFHPASPSAAGPGDYVCLVGCDPFSMPRITLEIFPWPRFIDSTDVMLQRVSPNQTLQLTATAGRRDRPFDELLTPITVQPPSP